MGVVRWRMKNFFIVSVCVFCGFIIWAMVFDFIGLTNKGEQHLNFFWNKLVSSCQNFFDGLITFFRDYFKKAVISFKDWVNEF